MKATLYRDFQSGKTHITLTPEVFEEEVILSNIRSLHIDDVRIAVGDGAQPQFSFKPTHIAE